jgi:hydroxymethylbilane synthase
MAAGRLRAATRGSALARWQTDHVASLLGGDVEIIVVETTGDRRADTPIWEMGGKGVFVKEVQAAVLEGRADIAVHSGKDLPAATPDGLVLGAVPERADPRDALVGAALDDLVPGALVATGSARRRAQLAWLRPDLTFTDLRGNIDTRLRKVPRGGAVVMAAAALDRLGLTEHAAEVLDPSLVLPQVAQGALAVECRAGDTRAREALAAIEHRPSRRAVDAERAFLARLGGDCDLPAGAYATVDGEGRVTMEAMLASLDGHIVLRDVAGPGDDPGPLGEALAARLLDDHGGAAVLA